MKRIYWVYDGRARGGDTDDSIVLCMEDTLTKAKKSARSFGDAVVFSYQDNGDGELVTDERYEYATNV